MPLSSDRRESVVRDVHLGEAPLLFSGVSFRGKGHERAVGDVTRDLRRHRPLGARSGGGEPEAHECDLCGQAG